MPTSVRPQSRARVSLIPLADAYSKPATKWPALAHLAAGGQVALVLGVVARLGLAPGELAVDAFEALLGDQVEPRRTRRRSPRRPRRRR